MGKSISAFELGAEVIESMNQFSVKDTNLRDTKLTDWPAFKHSKSTTVKAFEKEYIYISIRNCNEYNLIVDIEGLPYKESELKIKSTISFYADKDKIGERILKVYEACLTGKI
jgi:hypothetical protein